LRVSQPALWDKFERLGEDIGVEMDESTGHADRCLRDSQLVYSWPAQL
jgi:hypothetical protein